ncbi:Gfo/Idh/MocA family oxidoreductase [Ruminococcaceae bacterium OttesenSCG-928-D13]|nr:Gfo/Idh/MocA family oxidoreductase [Ruminococcaceae bacterium OttesenSCG-928-D13]
MSTALIGVGIIGCGTISEVYLTNLTTRFNHLKVVACADIDMDKARAAQEKFGLPKAATVEELLADPEVQIVVNLTIPAAHHEINMKAMKAGKNVYCEKPLAMTLADANEEVAFAEQNSLLLGSAPDTFLGAGLQTCRKLIDEKAIGELVGFTANLMSPGHDLWHPAPVFYYKKGAGPMMDMGPYYITALVSLLGPIDRLACFAKTARSQREIQGEMVDVEVYTHYAGMMEFASGVMGNVNMSFDVWKSKLPGIEIYGTEGTLYVPDPNMFGGPVHIFKSAGLVDRIKTTCNTPVERIMTLSGPASDEYLTEVELAFPAEDTPRSNMRGMGVADMAQSLRTGRKSRLSGALSAHVVEALTAFDTSAESGLVYKMTTTCERPQPMAGGLALWQLD